MGNSQQRHRCNNNNNKNFLSKYNSNNHYQHHDSSDDDDYDNQLSINRLIRLHNDIDPQRYDQTKVITTNERYKILLLGTGEGGKATLFKQMQHLYYKVESKQETHQNQRGRSFSPPRAIGECTNFRRSLFSIPEHRMSYTPIIHRNALLAMYNLCRGATEHFQFTIHNAEAEERIGVERDICLEQEYWKLKPEIASDIRALWDEEEALHETYHKRHEVESSFESAKYWFDSIERLAKPNYLPTLEDIMHMRVKTTGIVDHPLQFMDLHTLKDDSNSLKGKTIHMRNKTCSLILTGSQRTERKKWSETWKNGDVSAIIFVVSLSEYNQVLYEDGRTNRMQESILLFEELVNSSILHNIPVYLFFNKQDLFLEKIGYYDLSACPQWKDTLPPELRLEDPFNSFIPSLFSQNTRSILERSRALKNSINPDASHKFDVEEMIQKLTKKSKSRSFFNSSRHFSQIDKSGSNLWSDTSSETVSTIGARYHLQLLTDDFLEKNGVRMLEYEDMELEETKLLDLPTDALLQICMFLESHDLNRLGMTCFELHVVTSSDFVWKALTLSYQPLVSEDDVLRVFKRSAYYQKDADNHERDDAWHQQQEQRQDVGEEQEDDNITERNSVDPSSGLLQQEDDNGEVEDSSTFSTISSNNSCDHHDLIGVKTPWHYYYDFCENWYQRNVEFIVNEFLSRTSRSDIKIFVTCAIDHQSLKPILDTVMHEVLFQRDGIVSSPQNSPNCKKGKKLSMRK